MLARLFSLSVEASSMIKSQSFSFPNVAHSSLHFCDLFCRWIYSGDASVYSSLQQVSLSFRTSSLDLKVRSVQDTRPQDLAYACLWTAFHTCHTHPHNRRTFGFWCCVFLAFIVSSAFGSSADTLWRVRPTALASFGIHPWAAAKFPPRPVGK